VIFLKRNIEQYFDLSEEGEEEGLGFYVMAFIICTFLFMLLE
jgi:hypothetical protein